MTRAFADTFFFLALLNRRDVAHRRAMDYISDSHVALLTTSWVLTELADGLSHPTNRPLFSRVLSDLRADPESMIVEPSVALFDQGIALYSARSDKHWSLTDCLSFVVMEQHGVTEALTGDHHFEQAGFKALLRDDSKP